jgi:peptide deformylase
MPRLPIRLFPDPVLRIECEPVTSFDNELARLIEDMVETMYAAPGIGLAAPQVGDTRRIFLVDLSVGEVEGDLHVVINPQVAPVGDDGEADSEGCLSIPDFTEKVLRPAAVLLRAQKADGSHFELEADGLLARAIQHENDHINGVLFVDHLRGLRRERAKRHLRKLQRDSE